MDAKARHRVHHRARRRWRVSDDTRRVCALSRTRTKDLNKVGGLSNGPTTTSPQERHPRQREPRTKDLNKFGGLSNGPTTTSQQERHPRQQEPRPRPRPRSKVVYNIDFANIKRYSMASAPVRFRNRQHLNRKSIPLCAMCRIGIGSGQGEWQKIDDM